MKISPSILILRQTLLPRAAPFLPEQIEEVVATWDFDPANGDYVQNGGFHTFEIPKSLIQTWVADPNGSNYGIALDNPGGNLRFGTFDWYGPNDATSRVGAKLEVTFAALLDFEYLAPGTEINSLMLDGVLVSFSAGASLTVRSFGTEGELSFLGAGGTQNSPLAPSDVAGNQFISSVGTGCPIESCTNTTLPIDFTFSSPVSGFGLTTFDMLETGDPAIATLTLEVFDESGALVGTQTLTGPQGDSGVTLDFYISTNADAPDIISARLSGAGLGEGFGVDDVVLHREPDQSSRDALQAMFDPPYQHLPKQHFGGNIDMDNARILVATENPRTVRLRGLC